MDFLAGGVNVLDSLYIKEIYEKTYSAVYNYLFHLTLSREKTEDLTSMTFLRMIEKFSLYKKEKGNIKTWLLALARNIWIDEMRKESKWNWEQLESWEEVPEESNTLQYVENASVIAELLGRLTPRERELIYLRYYAGMSYREIAQTSGLTEKNVSVILSRSLQKMKKNQPTANG